MNKPYLKKINEILKQVSERHIPTLVTKDEQPTAVILSYETYQQLLKEREKILSLPKESLELKELPSISLDDTRVEQDLFGWKLTYGKRKGIRDSIKCRSQEETRYIKALDGARFPIIIVPKDDEYIKNPSRIRKSEIKDRRDNRAFYQWHI
ncbi:MAG: type II toxin-antitoxin system Phd/YefM family antitoxin [Candidatus Poribacteria bacterium]